MLNLLAAISFVAITNLNSSFGALNSYFAPAPKELLLSSHTISLNDRYPVESVNQVFKDNILLNLAYLRGLNGQKDLTWQQVEQPFSFQVRLEPNQYFAYHDAVLPNFQGKINLTTNAHFNSQEGFKSDGYLVGDGVCHLASLIYWDAKDAGIYAYAPTNHDFANIPEIPKQYGVAIYASPTSTASSAQENLYIGNTTGNPVLMRFDYDGTNLKMSMYQEVSGKTQIF